MSLSMLEEENEQYWIKSAILFGDCIEYELIIAERTVVIGFWVKKKLPYQRRVSFLKTLLHFLHANIN